MNKNDFKNPLIQSGAILLFVFLLISIVAGSGSQGVGGSIGALFSALMSGILFLIALLISIVVSIAVMVGLFIVAVAIYSVDRAKEIWCGVLEGTNSLLQALISSGKAVASGPASRFSGAGGQNPAAAAEIAATTEKVAALEAEITSLTTTLTELSKQLSEQAETIEQLKKQTADTSYQESVEEQIAGVTAEQKTIESRIAEVSANFTSESESRQEFEKQISEKIETVLDDVKDLQEKTSVPDTVSGILSYIDLAEDRDLVTEKAKEAISRGMTYSQVDDFFKSTLKPEVYEELASHPRLTKDFLRTIKKQF